ncbi:MAG TPA: alkaline phosphatase family protein [Terriglobales bacterium]
MVSSSPSGINCGSTCSANFHGTTEVTLTATPNSGFTFVGWGGACSGTGDCTISSGGESNVTATFGASLQSINHIIIMAQENRDFDHYFGKLNDYRVANALPADVDGLPAGASNPTFDGTGTIEAYHLLTMCVENPSPSWNESHVDRNLSDPVSATATLDGFVHTAAHAAMDNAYTDVLGKRAMGYYDASDLPYYYFMATNFATSDRWFSPVMSRTQLNRMYMLAGTSAGHAYPLPEGSPKLANKTIFELLDEHGITWKNYVVSPHPDPIGGTSFNQFAYAATHQQNIVDASQFLTDAKNGALPAVSIIDPGYWNGLDEHPGIDEDAPGASVQKGAAYVAGLINGLMNSPSWQDSVFILTWDEFGGFYDHVPPQPTVSPDGIPPQDLLPGDICTVKTGPTCDFDYTGYRLPLIVISPFAKKNYVSHTVADYTAMLKLIETRFDLPSLTARDAAQVDMTEFFDFSNATWRVPPEPPTQPTNGPCYFDRLP